MHRARAASRWRPSGIAWPWPSADHPARKACDSRPPPGIFSPQTLDRGLGIYVHYTLAKKDRRQNSHKDGYAISRKPRLESRSEGSLPGKHGFGRDGTYTFEFCCEAVQFHRPGASAEQKPGRKQEPIAGESFRGEVWEVIRAEGPAL